LFTTRRISPWATTCSKIAISRWVASFRHRAIKTNRARKVLCNKIRVDQLPQTIRAKGELNRRRISIIEVEAAVSFSNKIRFCQTRPVDSCKITWTLTTLLKSNKFWSSKWLRDSTHNNLKSHSQVAHRIHSDTVKNNRLNTNKSINSRCKSIPLQTESWTKTIPEPNTSLRSWIINKVDNSSNNFWISKSKCYKTITSRLFAVSPTVAIVTTISSSLTPYRAKTCKWCRIWVRWPINRWLACKTISNPGRGELTIGKRLRVSICLIRRVFLTIWIPLIC